MVLDVTDVLVSHSSVVTEFCDGFSCLFFLQTANTLLHKYATRDEVCKFTSESASIIKKKNETAVAIAKFERCL